MENGQLNYPKKLYLDDGTEVRLVPIERTGKPLYVSKDGKGYSYVRERLRIVKASRTCPKYPSQTRLFFRKFTHIQVHRAVLEAWGYPRPEGMECDHKNGDPFDNRLENLEWVTRDENARRRWELHASKGLSYNGKPISELSKDALRRRGTYRKKGKLVQLTINLKVCK